MEKARINGVYGSVANSSEPEAIDLISNLPDGVIGHILSSLPTKDAVKTSILSRNWKYKWTNIYNISVEFGKNDNPASFVSFMDRLLLLITDRSTTMKFTLQMFGENYSNQLKTNQLKTWIQKLILVRNIQSLTIFVPSGGQSNELPICFYNSSSLIHLKLYFPGVLNVPVAKNCFSNLKVLWLDGGYNSPFEIRNEQFPITDRISLTFPVLETLVLRCKWTNAKFVEICAPELIKYICWSIYDLNDLCKIKINCGSKLSFLGLNGNSIPNYVLSGQPSHLSLLNLDRILDHGVYVSQAHRILKRLPKINSLHLSDELVEPLVQSSKSRLGFPALPQLKELKLSFSQHWPSNKDILELLQLLPSVESLNIIHRLGRYGNKEQDDHVGEAYTLPYIKEVQFFEFYGYECEVSLAELILKNAKNIEKMVVEVVEHEDSDENKIRQQLSKLIPKTSSCVLVVTTHKQ